MQLVLASVLSPEDLETLARDLADVVWQDGARSAGPLARAVKRNRQASSMDARVSACGAFVHSALARQDGLQRAMYPVKWSPVLFSRYGPSEHYGAHVDNAIMGEGQARLRADIAFTLFLTEPDQYEGGELVIEGIAGEQAIKLAAGSAFLYPAFAIHRVEPVRSGERRVAVGWIQSAIRSAEQREILFDLQSVQDGLGRDHPAALILSRSIAHLLRLWGE